MDWVACIKALSTEKSVNVYLDVTAVLALVSDMTNGGAQPYISAYEQLFGKNDKNQRKNQNNEPVSGYVIPAFPILQKLSRVSDRNVGNWPFEEFSSPFHVELNVEINADCLAEVCVKNLFDEAYSKAKTFGEEVFLEPCRSFTALYNQALNYLHSAEVIRQVLFQDISRVNCFISDIDAASFMYIIDRVSDCFEAERARILMSKMIILKSEELISTEINYRLTCNKSKSQGANLIILPACALSGGRMEILQHFMREQRRRKLIKNYS